MTIRFRAALLGSSALFISTGAVAQTTPPSQAEVKEVVVTAPRQEVVARAIQYKAVNLINVQAAETIVKYPDFNAAEALGRIPGVSISTDTGEGRFVNIRGIDGNLAGATFGGVPLLNTYPGGTYFGGGGRAVEYDTIPTGSIDGLVVYKTTLPDHEAEGLGGSVDLTPRTAADITKPFFEGTLGYGYEPMHGHAGPLDTEGAVGARFGFNGSHLIVEGDGADEPVLSGWITNPTPFSIVLTASRREDRRGFDDIEEDYTDTTVDRSYQDLQFRRYDYHRRRFGYGGEFDFKPNDDNAFYLRGNVAGYTEAVKKNRLTYDDLNDTVDPSNPKGFATPTDITLTSTDEEETHRNQVYVAGGDDHFGDVVLDYRASYSRATYDQTKNYGAKFKGPQGLAFSYDNTANNGNFPQINADTALIDDPSQYKSITDVSNSTEHDVDREYAYAANLLIPMHVFSAEDNIKIGGEVRLRQKTSDPYSFDDTITPLALSSASGPSITDFYGQYTNGPNINTDVVRAAAQAAAQAGDQTGGLDQSGLFTAREDIYAAYAEYQAEIGKLALMAGVRVEATRALYGAYSNDTMDQSLQFVSREDDYTNAFPTVQARYQVNSNFLIRATFSTGIGRPGFLQNTAAISSNFDTSSPTISQGNPSLKPTTGDNFDLSLEYYLPKGGILQLGAFDKQFQNYIVTISQFRLYTGAYLPFQGMQVDYVTFGNRGGAYARGLEAAYHQQFQWLPGLWSGLGVEANGTLVDSHIEEYDAVTSSTGHAEYGLLPGTSRLTWNLAGFYEANRWTLRLAAEYVSKELFGLGGSKATDTIQDNRLTLDFTSSYQLTPNWGVYFNVKNLTDEPLRFYQNNSSFPIQREYYGQTYELGVRARF